MSKTPNIQPDQSDGCPFACTEIFYVPLKITNCNMLIKNMNINLTAVQ